MDISDRLLPEIAALKAELPAVLEHGIDRGNVAEARVLINEGLRLQAEAERDARREHVRERVVSFTGRNGEIGLLVLEPATRKANGPAMLWIHGGGYICGEADCAFGRHFAFEANCTVVSVDYRLAPEHPFPAGVEDAYDALIWLSENAETLDVDPRNIAVGGVSGGGGLAAGLCLMNRDLAGVDVIFQFLVYPMLDNLHDTPSGRMSGVPAWNRRTSLNAWEMYLNGTPGHAASPYASAARAADLSGLPPTYICVGQFDLFRDECITYAQRLMDAGVAAELGVFPHHVHGSEVMLPDLPISQPMRKHRIRALRDGLGL